MTVRLPYPFTVLSALYDSTLTVHSPPLHHAFLLSFSHTLHVLSASPGGLQVECTAVQRPGVDIAAVQGLATSLGAHSFASSKYFS